MSAVPVSSSQAPVSSSLGSVCAVALLEHDVLVPPSAHTLAGFRAWAKSAEYPERGRISFLDQEIIIDMSPEELETHNQVKLEVERTLANFNKKKKLGKLYADRTLITNVDANLSTEPECSFVSWKSLESEQARLVPREDEEGQYVEIEGTPDWVLEIVSDSSVRKDTKTLRDRYHKAGIPEYWLIDARGEEIDFQILVREKSSYTSKPGRGGWQRSPVFKRQFLLVRRRGRLGLYEYTLQSKPLR